MRAFVVAGLVVFHSAVVFAAGASWFVTDPRPSAVFTVFLLWGSLWGMPLLFLISGMGARYAMRARPAAAFARERLARLGVPFVAGLAVLVPPMFYLERLAQPAFHQSYWRFWLSFVNLPAIAAGLLPRGSWTSGGVSFDPAHLWFLYVLLVFSVGLLPLFAYLRGPRGRLLTGRLAGSADRHGGVVVFASRGPHDGDRGGVRPGCQHRRLGTRDICLPVPVRVPDRLRPAVRGRAAAVPLASPGGCLRGDRGAGGLGGCPERIGRRSQRRAGGLERAAGPGRLGVDRGDHGVRRVSGRAAGRPAAGHARPAPGGAPAAMAPRRPVRERSGAALLPAARAGHRGGRLAHRPLAGAEPRQVRGAGHRVLRRDSRPVRGAGPAVPRHPAPIRHETPHQARDPAPGSASDRRG